MDMFEKIKEIIIRELSVDPPERVTMDARFKEDLEADSLDLVELIMAFEDEFGGEISDDEAQKIKTVRQAVDYMLFTDRVAPHPHGGPTRLCIDSHDRRPNSPIPAGDQRGRAGRWLKLTAGHRQGASANRRTALAGPHRPQTDRIER
jgi:acyl carrier protein